MLDEDENIAYGSDLWKNYISTMAAMICNVDAEVSECFLHTVDFKKESVIDGINLISNMPEFCRRGVEDGGDHILWLYRNKKYAEINHRIWASQVKVLFPVIEMERIDIVEKYRYVISRSLAASHIAQYGEQITDPMDVEFGTLRYMMSHKKGNGEFMLYISDEHDKERIQFLHECRNLLAHVSICIPEQVRKLIDKE